MSSLTVTGGRRLSGEISLQGAKNSALPILAASILSAGETVLTNVPALTDVEAALAILRHLGCRAEFSNGTVWVDSSTMTGWDIPDPLMRRMRSSVVFLGAILARTGQAALSLPGGCELGPRPIDLHLDAMERLGAVIRRSRGRLLFRAPELRGARIDLKIPSVGATENAMIAAAGARGLTLIVNAAREPEIRDLARYLNAMGAKISGAGTSTVTVEGGAFAPIVRHRVIPDRIAAATYIAAVASAGGRIVLRQVCERDLTAVNDVFRQMGVCLCYRCGTLVAAAGERIKPPLTVTTRPYPGFPTDAQPPLMAAALRARGTSAFVETIFENRFRHVPELVKMGADIRVDGQVARVYGGRPLHGAAVTAPDLRGGAALLTAALAAEGETTICGTEHILRGYEAIDRTFRALGADIKRDERTG